MRLFDSSLVGELPSVGPAVIEPRLDVERPEQEPDDLPEVLYLPCRPRAADEELTLELRPLEDGRLAMLVFTSLDRLVDGCGEAQPWVAVESPSIDLMLTHCDANVVLLDTVLPEHLRHGRVRR